MPQSRYVISTAVLAAFFVVAPAASAAEGDRRPALVDRIAEVQRKTWRWQDVMQRRRTVPKATREELAAKHPPYQLRSLEIWRNRKVNMREAAESPPHKREFMCIHRHEGPWDANTGNGYYGGLQMDLAFQRQYSSWRLRERGTADTWTPLEQIWVAERAVREGRGFHPWPTPARRCGLI
jgi:hypothetical protein